MTPGIILFWHLVFAFVGVLIGIVIGYQWERRFGRRAPTVMAEPKPVDEADAAPVKAGWTADGQLWLEMNGVHLVNKTELNPDQQKRLSGLLQDLSPWVPSPEAAVKTTPAAAPVAPRVKVPEKKPAPATPAPLMKSIIEQINDVLQAKLSTSAFKNRGIQLIEGPGGSVIVEDGLKSYEGIEAVPDAEIKALIRESVAEWEKIAK